MSQFSTSVPPGGIMSDPEPKTSLAAILGFVVSLIGCCLPMGMLGVVLGVFGLMGIKRAEGRTGGRGLAIAAIIIGILNTIIWIGAVVGALSIGRSISLYGVKTGEFLTLIESGEYDQSRVILGGTMTGADDDSLKAFSDAVHSNLGSYVSTPDSLGSLWAGYIEFGKQLSQNQIPMSMPIPLQFQNGKALVQYVFDPAVTTNGVNQMTDLQIIEADGTVHRLANFVTVGSIPPPSTTPETSPDATEPVQNTPTEEIPSGSGGP